MWCSLLDILNPYEALMEAVLRKEHGNDIPEE